MNNPTHNIFHALRTLGENIELPAPDDTMAEMVLQTKALCLDAANRMECLAKAATGLARGRRYWKTRAKKAEEEVAIAKMIALAALDKVTTVEAQKKFTELLLIKTQPQNN